MLNEIVNIPVLYSMLENANTELPSWERIAGGVYFLYNAESEIIYVGKASNVKTRYDHHLNGSNGSEYFYKEIVSFRYIEVETPTLRTFLEGAYIELLKPKYNTEVRGNRTSRDKRLINDEQAIQVKKSLMNGDTPKEIAERMNIKRDVIYKIRVGGMYRNVEVEGFDEWAENYNKKRLKKGCKKQAE